MEIEDKKAHMILISYKNILKKNHQSHVSVNKNIKPTLLLTRQKKGFRRMIDLMKEPEDVNIVEQSRMGGQYVDDTLIRERENEKYSPQSNHSLASLKKQSKSSVCLNIDLDQGGDNNSASSQVQPGPKQLFMKKSPIGRSKRNLLGQALLEVSPEPDPKSFSQVVQKAQESESSASPIVLKIPSSKTIQAGVDKRIKKNNSEIQNQNKHKSKEKKRNEEEKKTSNGKKNYLFSKMFSKVKRNNSCQYRKEILLESIKNDQLAQKEKITSKKKLIRHTRGKSESIEKSTFFQIDTVDLTVPMIEAKFEFY